MRGLLIMCFVLGAVGCSSGGDDEATSTASSATVAPTTTTTLSPAAKAKRQLAADKAKIRQKFQDINDAFRTSGEAGVAAQASANYNVGIENGFTAEQCLASYRASPFTDIVEVREETITPVPGWFHFPLTGPPKGRTYEFAVDDTYTDTASGKVTKQTADRVHATVLADGTVKLFINCS
jgi:hypothetical protein